MMGLMKYDSPILSVVFAIVLFAGAIALDAFGISILPWWGSAAFLVFAIALAAVNPFAAFALAAGTIAMETVSVLPESFGPALRPYLVFAVSALAVYSLQFTVYRLQGGKTENGEFRLPRICLPDVGVLFVAFGGFAAAMFSPEPAESFRLSVIFLSFVLLYTAARIFIRSMEDVRRIAPAFFTGAFLVSVFAILQNLAFLHDWGIWQEVMPGRPNAFFSEPDWLGMFVAIGLLVLWVCGERLSGIFFPRQVQTFFCGVLGRYLSFPLLSFVITTALLITVSRSAWLAAAAGTVILIAAALWRYRLNALKRFVWPAVSVLAVILAVQWVPLTNFELGNRAQSSVSGLQEITISCERDGVLPERIADVSELASYGCRHIDLEEIAGERERGAVVTRIAREDPNAQERKGVWEKSLSALAERPFAGIGWGGIAPMLGQDPRGEDLNASNIFLEVWLGAGAFGILGLLLAFGWMAFWAVRMIVSKDERLFRIGVLTGSVLAAAAVFNLFNAAVFLGIFWLWLGVSAGVLARGRNRE